MAFKAEEHLIDLKGKKYLPVAARIQWFRTDNPDGAILTELVVIDADQAVVKATVLIGGNVIGMGYAACAVKVAPNGRYVEKAETSAIGRALGIAGYGTQFSGDDLDEGDHLSDAPQEYSKPAPKGKATPAAETTGPTFPPYDAVIGELDGKSLYALNQFGWQHTETGNAAHFKNKWQKIYQVSAIKNIPGTVGEFLSRMQLPTE